MKFLKFFFFLFFTVLLTFCGTKNEKELFDDATSLINEQKFDEAVVIFEQIVNDNKDSKLAPKALFECAKIYQGQVIKNLSPKESLIKSVEIYKKVFEDYSKSEDAENSLFMAAFILANDLNDLEGAKLNYELYLKHYPDGKLSRDAKIELQNLGKAPEEILKDKIQVDFENEKTI